MTELLVKMDCSACGTVTEMSVSDFSLRAEPGTCASCAAPLMASERPRRPISVGDYILPADRTAMLGLARVPGLIRLVQLFARRFSDEDISLEHFADDLRVTASQLPDVYARYVVAGQRLGFSEDALPLLFIRQDPIPNAFTRGVERAVIVVTTGLMDLMDDDELQAVLGHELGHVQAGHYLYSTALAYADRLGRLVSQLTPTVWDNLIMGIAATPAVLAWRRAGEITADRAGVIAGPRPMAMLTALMKLAGAPADRIASASLEEFAHQAVEYEHLRDETLVRRLMMVEDILYRGHPFPVVRLGAATAFLADGAYMRALRAAAANDVAAHAATCPHCDGSVSDWDVVCRHCAWGIKRVDGATQQGEEPPDEGDPSLREALADRGQQSVDWVRSTVVPTVSASGMRAAKATSSWVRDLRGSRSTREVEEDDKPDQAADR